MPGGNLIPLTALRLSSLATGQLAGRPTCPTGLPRHSPLALRGERESQSHDDALLPDYPAPWPFVSDGHVVAWCACTVEEKKIIACVSVDRLDKNADCWGFSRRYRIQETEPNSWNVANNINSVSGLDIKLLYPFARGPVYLKSYWPTQNLLARES